MGRRRSFDEAELLDQAAQLFVFAGYEGTSVEALVRALNVHRGSLYAASDSKRGLFLAALRWNLETVVAQARPPLDALAVTSTLDLLLVAAVELAPRNAEAAAEVRSAGARLAAALAGPDVEEIPIPALALGLRLWRRAQGPTTETPPWQPLPSTPISSSSTSMASIGSGH